jgi:2-ketocyclohexanecarboxyl-CoA hydrolase
VLIVIKRGGNPLPEYEDILLERANGVARLAINRPKTYNAFRGETLRELADAYRLIKDDHDIGVVVLTGVGDKAFCSGGDVQWEAQGSLEGEAMRLVSALYEAMRSSYKPTIARVNGYAIGGGNHLAYTCDFTIAAENAIFGQNGPRVGSPANAYYVSYLARIVGHKRAREMWMLCRRYSAKQALEWGLVNAVVPMDQLDAEVKRWCDELLALSPTCLKVLKAAFDDEFRELRNLKRNYLAEINPAYFTSGEQMEGAKAFLEKRPPDFRRWR